jgi:hypothetical protein
LPAFADESAGAGIAGIWERSQFGRFGHPREVAMTEAGKRKQAEFSAENDPTLKCIMPGVPLGVYDPYPLEIIVQDHQVVFLYEHFHMVRRIFTDGRSPDESWPDTLNGYSVGHWEDGVLVVKTTHMQGGLMSNTGRPFSGGPDTWMIERYWRDGDLLMFEADVFDAENYQGPYRITGRWQFAPNVDIYEYECFPEYGGIQ